MADPAYRYTATIGRWVDGDTAIVTADLGWHITAQVRVRLRSLAGGLDTPERHTPGGDAALARSAALAPPGTVCTLHSFALDQYGRTLGALVLDTGLDVGAELVAEGHARPWDGRGAHPAPTLPVGEGS